MMTLSSNVIQEGSTMGSLSGARSASSYGYSAGVADDPVTQVIDQATASAHAVQRLAHDFNVPAEPIAAAVNKISAGVHSSPPDAAQIESGKEDLLTALTSPDGGSAEQDSGCCCCDDASASGAGDSGGTGGSGDRGASGGSSTPSGAGTPAGSRTHSDGGTPAGNATPSNSGTPAGGGASPTGYTPAGGSTNGGTNYDAIAAQMPPDQRLSKSDLLDRVRQALIAMGMDPSVIDSMLPMIEQWLDNPASSTGSLDTTPPVTAPTDSPYASHYQYQPLPQGFSSPISQTPQALKTSGGTTSGVSPSPSSATGENALTAKAIAANPELAPYADDIAEASRQTGLDPGMIGAMIHAESRGNQGTSTTNGDGSNDVGLMQISRGRLGKDNLSAEDQAKIKAENGKSFDQLDVSNAHDNIIAGAWHMKHFLGQSGGNIDQALGSYVGRDPLYIKNVHTFWSELNNGVAMTNDAGTPI
jgi:hypothetical protein